MCSAVEGELRQTSADEHESSSGDGSLAAAPQMIGRAEKTLKPQDFSLTKKTARFTKGPFSSLLRTENGLTTDIFVVKYTGRGFVVKRRGVLGKVQMLNLVLGVGVFSPLPR